MDILDIFAVIISALLIAIGMQSLIIYCEIGYDAYAQVCFACLALSAAINYCSATANFD